MNIRRFGVGRPLMRRRLASFRSSTPKLLRGMRHGAARHRSVQHKVKESVRYRGHALLDAPDIRLPVVRCAKQCVPPRRWMVVHPHG